MSVFGAIKAGDYQQSVERFLLNDPLQFFPAEEKVFGRVLGGLCSLAFGEILEHVFKYSKTKMHQIKIITCYLGAINWA